MLMNRLKYIVLLVILAKCKQIDSTTQFELLKSSKTGVTFRNDLTFNKDFNVYTYRNYYNGGGVAIGDINNDGFADIYFTANQKPNELYLNKGDFQFENISGKSNTEGQRAWSTGVTMVDINADGLLDIYVCNSGDIKGSNKQNELFVNNGDLTFSEKATEYGLADPGYSTHSSFFDYDRDGDLDVYLLNNSYQAIGSFDLRRNERPKRDSLGGDKLLRNDDGKFVDVSLQAGIYGSIIGFGLGVTVGDVNGDHWDDIYVSNDFFERDYLYLNNQDGTFSEVFTEWIQSTSGASMGADMADINNDGNNDIFITEMLPRDDKRLKSVTTFEDWNRYQYSVQNDYYHQFTRNTFQVNTGSNRFLELGRFSNVEATDWSWGALMFDLNNDGYRDIYVANGIYRDLTDQDYLQYIANEEVIKSIVTKKEVDYGKLINLIPSNPIPNYTFINNGKLNFVEKGRELGLAFEGFSNGAAYGDLDNDGDLDIVVNNVNGEALVYQNKLSGGNSIQVITKGEKQNPFGYGAKIWLESKNYKYYIEQQPARGFQSSMDQKLLIGLANNEELDVRIIWPSGKYQRLNSIEPNNVITLKESEAYERINHSMDSAKSRFIRLLELDTTLYHIENQFIDFNRDRLLNHMLSTFGPKLAYYQGNSQLTIFQGSSKGNYPQTLRLNDKNSLVKKFKLTSEKPTAENGESVFFDADNDGDLDLYVTSGGVEVSQSSTALRDRLYFNQGDDSYVLSDQMLPVKGRSVGCSTVDYSDIDGDSDLDLFVGEFTKPLKYGLPCNGFILLNDGHGIYEDKTSELAPDLNNIGMITDAEFADFDGDKDEDLIIVGDYTGINLFENIYGSFVPNESLINLKGWWNTIHIVDIDSDGDLDFFVGNHGLNSRFKASFESPIRLYVGDFDANGFIDPILTKYQDGKSVPYALRHNLIDQIKSLKKIYPDYASYKEAHIEEMFTPEILKKAYILEANTLESSLFINEGEFKFTKVELPLEIQFSPIYAASSGDYDRDGDIDLIVGGNLYGAKPEIGRYDASSGLMIENQGSLQFKTDMAGLGIEGQVRDIITTDSLIIVARNNDSVLFFSY